MFIKFSYVEALERIYLDALKSQQHKTKVLAACRRCSCAGL